MNRWQEDEDLTDFVKKLIVFEADNRMTSQQALKHSYLQTETSE